MEFYDRVYLPSKENTLDIKAYLSRYIENEFPIGLNNNNAVYSIPKTFKRIGEPQASLAEQVVFERLSELRNLQKDGLWILFIHDLSYMGNSYRNERVGKLIVREHDFVVFVKHKDSNYVFLIEVKSTCDGKSYKPNIIKTGDAKIIKNNKRSAQHQLRDHMEMLKILHGCSADGTVQQYICWPFLGSLTTDPQQNVIERWKEDLSLHLFENCLSDQSKFDEWFHKTVLNGVKIETDKFTELLNRYLILSCGVFVDEISNGQLALLTQEQLQLINLEICQKSGAPLVVHGAAGTGKTLLIIKKLQQLHELGKLDENNKALYVCYWPGIKCEVEEKLKRLNLSKFVDTARFYISQTGFLLRNHGKYKHIFMDEAEALYLAFDRIISDRTFNTIYERYHAGNCGVCKEPDDYTTWGELWFLIDINQASIFIPRGTLPILKTPHVHLTRVMRTTCNIFNVFNRFYCSGSMNAITMGHGIGGPPITWSNVDTVTEVVIDLCGSKGFKPCDICVLPFLTSEIHVPEIINRKIEQYFAAKTYRPNCIDDVERFVSGGPSNEFLIAWVLRVKGLEFKVVVVVIDDDDFDVNDLEDQRKMYIMASRCTCMLVLVCSKDIKEKIDLNQIIRDYKFGLAVLNVS